MSETEAERPVEDREFVLLKGYVLYAKGRGVVWSAEATGSTQRREGECFIALERYLLLSSRSSEAE